VLAIIYSNYRFVIGGEGVWLEPGQSASPGPAKPDWRGRARYQRNRPATAFMGRKRRPAIDGNPANPKCW